MPSLRQLIVSLTAVAAVAGCTNDPTPPLQQGGDDASRLAAMADSVRDQGDGRGGDWLDHVAMLVRLAGGATPLIVEIDGEQQRFVAVAEEIELVSPPCFDPMSGVQAREALPPPGFACPQLPPRVMRTLVAWDPDEPRRHLRLSADSGASAAEPYEPRASGGGSLLPPPGEADTSRLPGDTAVILPMPRRAFTLIFSEPSSGGWYSIDGEQANARTALGRSCGEIAVRLFGATYECVRARFAFSATATLGHVFPSAVAGDRPGTRIISIPRQAVGGVRLSAIDYPLPPPPDDSVPPPPPPPPSDTAQTGLRHAVFVSVDSAGPVRLTLVVTNRNAEPVTLGFPSGQQYDFEVRSAESGALLWRWSADKAFTQALTSRTLAPGEEIRFAEWWQQTAHHGRMVGRGTLTSHTHPLRAEVEFVLP